MNLDLDHILLGGPDLADMIDRFATLTGVEASIGGRHPDFGTHNALIDLADSRYLELAAPDPHRTTESNYSKLFASLERPAVCGWCVRADNLASVAASLNDHDIETQAIKRVMRNSPEGPVVFDVLYPKPSRLEGHMPFFIDWLDTKHPSIDAPKGCRLMSVDFRHPEAALMNEVFSALNTPWRCEHASQPSFSINFKTPNGELRFD